MRREAIIKVTKCYLFRQFMFFFVFLLGPTPEELVEMEKIETEKRVCSHLWYENITRLRSKFEENIGAEY